MVFGVTGNPQGVFDYEGILPYVTSATMTLTPGVTPSVCAIRVNALPFVPNSNGTLTLSYGGVVINFLNCKMDMVSTDRQGSSGQTWSLTIYDRRWMWADRGIVHGHFNVHIFDELQDGTEKTPTELLELCMDALGETGYQLIGVPDDLRPEVDWDYTRPAEALTDLLTQLGMTICLGPADNLIYIIPNWYTTAVLDTVGVTAYDQQVDPPDPPRDLVIVGARTKFQHDFLLEPVCYDVDGDIKKIDDLSYAPNNNITGFPVWASQDNMCSDHIHDLDDERAKNLAKKYMWRMYRIIPSSTVDWEEPFDVLEDKEITGMPDGEIVTVVKDVELLDSLVQEVEGDDGERRPLPALVWGRYFDDSSRWRKNLDIINPVLVIDDPAKLGGDDGGEDPNGLYEGGFSIDSDKGIVMFNEQMCEYVRDKPVSSEPYPVSRFIPCTKLFLRTACHVRYEDQWKRFEYSSIPTQATNPAPSWAVRYEKREDIELYYKINKSLPSGNPSSNTLDCEEQGQYYWDTVALEYQPKDAMTVTYIGFRLIGCDGAIKQVTWSVGEDGRAFTRVSRHREEQHLSISFKERKFIERNKSALAEVDSSKQQMKVTSRTAKIRRAYD